MLYMVTFTMNIPQMLANIPYTYMDTMGYDICFFCHSRFSSRLTSAGPTLLFEGSKDYGKAKWGEQRISLRKGETKRRQSVQDSIKQEFMYMYRSTKEYWQTVIWQCFRAWRINAQTFHTEFVHMIKWLTPDFPIIQNNGIPWVLNNWKMGYH